MGVLIKIAGVTFDPKHVIDTVELPAEPIAPVYLTDYPVTDTLKGLFDLGSSQEASLVNHAPNSTATATVTGTVDFTDPRYATFSGKGNESRINTNVPLSLDNTITLVGLFSVPDGYRPIIGNKRGTGSTATHYGVNLLNSSVYLSSGGKSVVASFETPIRSNNFSILAMTADANGCRVLRYSNGGLTPWLEYEGSIDVWDTLIAQDNFKIGGDSTSSVFGTAHISLAAIHEGAMTDEQLESICEFVRSYGKYKGLIIE